MGIEVATARPGSFTLLHLRSAKQKELLATPIRTEYEKEPK